MTRSLSVGISTCPNDTFAFHALLTGEVEAEGLDLDFELLDVEELNRGLQAGRFDACKASAAAALALADRVVALPVGWALGHDVGPVVLAGPERAIGASRRPIVLCPGAGTTATLLWRLFHPEQVDLYQCVFSEIMPRLRAGAADLGVCIHEGRFTWQEQGLTLVEDLGETWGRATKTALPLGGLVARRTVAEDAVASFVRAVRASLAWGLAHRSDCLPTMRRHAQEQADDVLWSHVDLYVSAWTHDLGPTGRQALAALSDLARDRGLRTPGAALSVWRP